MTDMPSPKIDMDKPLSLGDAIANDALDRKGFAQQVAMTMGRVNSSSGFVLSVEGDWGSGKTSTLAMVEEFLLQKKTPPIIVRFNPWLVGSRDALLQQFLARIGTELKLADNVKIGKRVAKEIENYSKVFDVVKYVPGAWNLASQVKSIFLSVSEAVGGIADQKERDIEGQKERVEWALRKLKRPIIVFVDEIDRLFPDEVFEMIRIVKAVGDLPNVGYVLAWDSNYVSQALNKVGVPLFESYLDKIVQVRMPLPKLSAHAKRKLLNEALAELPAEALSKYFESPDDRLYGLYSSGLNSLIEQPRDIGRIFNALKAIEPALRGEIVFADILGLAVLMVKASPVFELLKKNPQWFVGRLPEDGEDFRESEEILREGKSYREDAYSQCNSPEAVSKLVRFLFPQIEENTSIVRISGVEGNLAARLPIALQLSLSPSDTSLREVRRYLSDPEQRAAIENRLTVENCREFLELLGDVSRHLEENTVGDLENLCISLARLVDAPFFVSLANRDRFFPPMLTAENVISKIIANVDEGKRDAICPKIVKDEKCISLAVRVCRLSYLPNEEEILLPVSDGDKEELLDILADNILSAAREGNLLNFGNIRFVLSSSAKLIPKICQNIFLVFEKSTQALDGFAVEILHRSTHSYGERAYGLPSDISELEAYCSLEKFRKIAQGRLADTSLDFPARAAWKSVVEGASFYEDGKRCDRKEVA